MTAHNMTAAELEKLLAEVTPGEWFADIDGLGHHRVGSFGHENYDGTAIHVSVQDNGAGYATVGKNARLIAMAPTLARKVIAAEKLATALRDAEWVIGNMASVLAAHGLTGTLTDPRHDIRAALAAWEATQ